MQVRTDVAALFEQRDGSARRFFSSGSSYDESRRGRSDIRPTRVRLSVGASIAFALTLTLAGCSGSPPTPNVLVICIDALRPDHLGAYGSTAGASPYLDRLAASSVVFDNAFSVASWTKPSVPSLLTGMYPGHHGVFDSSRHGVDVLADDVTTLAEVLQNAGYRTAAFVENSHLDRRYSHLDRGFGTYVDGAGEASHIVHRFLSWLEGANSVPFFAYLHFLDVHWPYTPETAIPGHESSTAERAKIIEWEVTGKRWWLLRNAVKQGLLTLSEADVSLLEGLYDAEIFDTDAAIGRMLELLDGRGILRHTLVIVTADHGEGFLDHGRLDHGYGLYDELLRIPLIVRLPETVGAGRRISAPVQIVDVAPTVLDVVGTTIPSLDGKSLLGFTEGRAGMGDRPLFFEEHHGSMVQVGVRVGNYKYIRTERAGEAPARDAFLVPVDLVAGVRVQAEGLLAGGRFIADEIKVIDPGDDDCELAGPLERITGGGAHLEVFGYDVRVPLDRIPTGEIKLVEGKNHFKMADLGELDWVRVHGEPRGRSFAATKVERLIDREQQEIEIEGIAGRLEVDGAGIVWLELCDDRITLSPDVHWKGVGPGRRELVAASVVPEARLEEELYDVVSDPGEQINLAPDNPSVLADLRAELSALRARFGDGRERARPTTALDPATRDRLRALGYLR